MTRHEATFTVIAEAHTRPAPSSLEGLADQRAAALAREAPDLADGLHLPRPGALRYIPSSTSTAFAPIDAGDGFSGVRPSTRSTSRSVTRSNDQRTSSSVSSAVTSSPPFERATRRRRHVQPHLASRACDPDRQLAPVAERPER